MLGGAKGCSKRKYAIREEGKESAPSHRAKGSVKKCNDLKVHWRSLTRARLSEAREQGNDSIDVNSKEKMRPVVEEEVEGGVEDLRYSALRAIEEFSKVINSNRKSEALENDGEGGDTITKDRGRRTNHLWELQDLGQE